jgi:phosphohistidine phosphatase
MKELIFLRHAKSDWGHEFLKDVDRCLNERGYSDAYFMSAWFAKNQKKPSLILCSTATRALSTGLIFARAMESDMRSFMLESRIYETTAAKLLALIREQDDKNDRLMLVGHNPSFTDICNEIAHEHYIDNIPTCGIVSLTFDTASWSDLAPKKGNLSFFQYPKNFKNQD